MRIVSRPEGPSFPSLETLLPKEKSWALEVEREQEASKHRLPVRGTESVKQTESSWVSRKRLNSGSEEVCRERESEFYSKRASRSLDSKPYRNDKHSDSSTHSEETSRVWQHTSSSRCYPPPLHSRSSEFSVAEERRDPPLRTQRGLHETRKFAKPNRTSDSFASRQHSSRSNNGISRETQARKPSANTIERRQDHFVCLNHRAELTSKKHADDQSQIRQDHQQLDECKHAFQPSFVKHRQYGHIQYCVKSGFSEHRSRHRYVKKMGEQGPCHGVADWKNAKKCRRSIESKMKQQNKAALTEQRFKEKPGAINDGDFASESVITTENPLLEGLPLFEPNCTGELEAKNDDSMVAKKQYDMLASLLFDDLQGITEDFDVTLVDEGPDCECSGSIFDDELEASMDIDVVTKEKEAVSGTALAECLTKRPDCNSRKASDVKSSGSQHAKKSQFSCSSLALKQSPSVLVDVTNKFEIHTSPGMKGEVQEDDAHRLSQRQRQIEFGKNTLGYERYCELIPRIKRKAKDPQTPNPKQVCSKRSWDGQIRKWRRLLHFYDPPCEDGEEIAEDFSILKLHRSYLEEKDPDAKEDTRPGLRFVEADESKGRIAVADTKIVEDANLTIYDDWMES